MKTGEHKGKKGKVSKIDLKKVKIYIEGVKVKKVSGQEAEIPIDPSNVVITKLFLEDAKRKQSMQRTFQKSSTKTESDERKAFQKSSTKTESDKK